MKFFQCLLNMSVCVKIADWFKGPALLILKMNVFLPKLRNM